ncbi:MAG TPA: hypothetical protein VJ836_01985 [Candidatus Saccharimonadales bacterium]|nr:hypothetical protein [Candidatus Saccharimonadales bacterium]
MQTGQSPRRYSPLLIIFVSLALALISFFIPVAPGVNSPAEAHWRTAVAIVVSTLLFGAALSFLRGLKGFKTNLRVAYILLAVGIITMSLAFFQLPIFGIFNLWETDWVDAGGAILPFGFATILVYLGARKFAKTLQVRSKLKSFWLVFAVTTVFTVLLGIAGSLWVQYELEGVEIYIAVTGWTAIYALFAGFLLHKITNTIGVYYHKAIRALEVAIFALGLGALHESLSTFYFNNGHAYNDWGIYLWPLVITGLLFVKAGYEFRLLALQAVDDKKEEHTKDATDRDHIDSIVAVASLASRPEEIDAILDDLRMMTAHLGSGTTLTAEDRRRALSIYHRLETYLTTSDPVRNFTKEEVRSRATPAFRTIIDKHDKPFTSAPTPTHSS